MSTQERFIADETYCPFREADSENGRFLTCWYDCCSHEERIKRVKALGKSWADMGDYELEAQMISALDEGWACADGCFDGYRDSLLDYTFNSEIEQVLRECLMLDHEELYYIILEKLGLFKEDKWINSLNPPNKEEA